MTFPEFICLLVILTIGCIALAAQIVSTAYVWIAAGRYTERFEARPMLLGRCMWTCVTLLFGGPIVAALFWLLHFSILNPRMTQLAQGQSTEFLDVMDALPNWGSPPVRPADVRRRKKRKEREQEQ